jgi:hypothetical protein
LERSAARRAWAAELLQSKKGQKGQGAHGQNHQQRQRQQHQQSQHPHPDGQRSGSTPGQSKPVRGQKRKATATTNGAADDGDHATTDDDRPAAKRRKERDSEGGRPPSPGPSAGAARAHPDFWHPDGSVVVEVEKTKFRLHQSTLQKHSAYFAALFREKGAARQHGGRAFLEVEVDEQSPNGHLPVYRVADTTADDFVRLLTVIEEPMYVRPYSVSSHFFSLLCNSNPPASDEKLVRLHCLCIYGGIRCGSF